MDTQPNRERPKIAILGRPNVGKSTLFNRLTRSRAALVADVPGLTRDPKVGLGRLGETGYVVIDTGGVDDGEHEADGLHARITEQALGVAEDCDTIIMLVDGRAGLNAADEQLAAGLRRMGRRTVLAINKCEGLDADLAAAEFGSLGFSTVFVISATHGDGVAAMIESITEGWPLAETYLDQGPAGRTRIAVVGRPNVGKSTLVNRILGEQRMIASELPGTTRDSVDSHFERDGRPYTIVDTAGLRRRARTRGIAEKYSAVQTLQSVERADVVMLLIDAADSVTEQDLTLLGMVIDSGRALVIVVNKWDGLDIDQREQVKRDLDRRLRFATYVEIRFVSALHGSGVGNLFEVIDEAAESAARAHRTGDLSSLLEQAVAAHPPPLVRGRRIKLRYAHMGGQRPPTIVIHGNQTDALPGGYKRYLENFLREHLGLFGTPIRLEFRQSDNPYAGRRNKLTPRQQAKRRRLMKHVKKGR